MHLLPQFLLTFIRKPTNKIWSAQWKPGNMESHRAHLPDPVRHGVSAWGAVVGVDDDDRDDDWSDDKHHCKQHVFAYQRHCTGGGGNQLHNDQKEHSQRQQDRDAESHFLTCHAKKTKTQTKKKPRNKKKTKTIAAPIIQYRLFTEVHVCASGVQSPLPASKAVTRRAKPESLRASAPALKWDSPPMTGLRYGWWVRKAYLPGALHGLCILNDEVYAPD